MAGCGCRLSATWSHALFSPFLFSAGIGYSVAIPVASAVAEFLVCTGPAGAGRSTGANLVVAIQIRRYDVTGTATAPYASTTTRFPSGVLSLVVSPSMSG